MLCVTVLLHTHYGFLASRSKKTDLAKIRKALNQANPEPRQKWSTRELLIKLYAKDPYLCPKCKKDSMVVTEITAGIKGSPKMFFAKDKKVQLAEI